MLTPITFDCRVSPYCMLNISDVHYLFKLPLYYITVFEVYRLLFSVFLSDIVISQSKWKRFKNPLPSLRSLAVPFFFSLKTSDSSRLWGLSSRFPFFLSAFNLPA